MRIYAYAHAITSSIDRQHSGNVASFDHRICRECLKLHARLLVLSSLMILILIFVPLRTTTVVWVG